MTVHVPANPELIRWAAEQVRDEAFLDNNEEFQGWISGERQPTWVKLQAFAKRVGIPFGYFFLDEVPTRTLPIADFREGYSADRGNSPELHDVLNLCIRRQDWYRDFAQEQGLPEVAVVGVARGWDPQKTAQHMRSALDFEVDTRRGSAADQRGRLIAAFEDLGGLTVFNSMVNDNTHRLLDPEEFRGFSLVDPLAPLVFVNAAQTKNGQLYTFAHELAHIWHGVSGIGNAGLSNQPQMELERWCNDVATEFLVPQEKLKELAHKLGISDYKLIDTQTLEELARLFKCGTLVVLFALKTLVEIPQNEFALLYREEFERLQNLQHQSAPQKSGGNINRNRKYRIGETFSRAVIGELQAGRLTPTEALRLTGIRSMSAFDSYAQDLAGSL